jgi:hypothetical protein
VSTLLCAATAAVKAGGVCCFDDGLLPKGSWSSTKMQNLRAACVACTEKYPLILLLLLLSLLPWQFLLLFLLLLLLLCRSGPSHGA